MGRGRRINASNEQSGLALPRLILFPGLGADARMFDPQRSLPVRLEIPPRLAPMARESLADYARRVASSLDTQEPFHLGGAGRSAGCSPSKYPAMPGHYR